MAHRWLKYMFHDNVTYWGNPTPNGRGGHTYATPVTFKARWEEKEELVKDSRGELVMGKARVFIDRDLEEGGLMYLGTSTSSNPEQVNDTRKIIGWFKIPTPDGKAYERRAILQ